MKILILKIMAFMIFLAMLVILNVAVFRSEFPMYWMATATGSVVILVLIPYKRLFNKKQI
jgi:hypothetical protein